MSNLNYSQPIGGRPHILYSWLNWLWEKSSKSQLTYSLGALAPHNLPWWQSEISFGRPNHLDDLRGRSEPSYPFFGRVQNAVQMDKSHRTHHRSMSRAGEVIHPCSYKTSCRLGLSHSLETSSTSPVFVSTYKHAPWPTPPPCLKNALLRSKG